MKAKRTIILGDIHGCLEELRELLSAVEAGPGDELISVGDLICKGPDSLGVLEWAMRTPNLRCVVGNHEARFLDCWRRGQVPDIKPYDRETYEQLGDRYEACMEFISTWPLFLNTEHCFVVHAGFDPRLSLEKQDASDLVNIRILSNTQTPWYQRYFEKRLVVFGHWAKKDPVVRENVIGLDTGCVYGGSLTALVMPERKLVSVPAQKVYREKNSGALA
ncbi:MAG TPA: metallophosphoesterase [Bdellovibrionota bacterium]